MPRALIIIDIQNDYFPGGAFPLVEPEAAADRAAELLAAFRASGEPVFHMQHVWDEPDAAFMRPGTPGIEIHDAVAPAGGEPVIQKESPNSFLETDLEDRLREAGAEELVVAGMMTSMCVDSTVRAAGERGFETTLVSDACAAPNLAHGGVEVPAAAVNAAFLGAIDGEYATVMTAAELLDG